MGVIWRVCSSHALCLSNLQWKRWRRPCGWAAALRGSCPAAASCPLPRLCWSKVSSPASVAAAERNSPQAPWLETESKTQQTEKTTKQSHKVFFSVAQESWNSLQKVIEILYFWAHFACFLAQMSTDSCKSLIWYYYITTTVYIWINFLELLETCVSVWGLPVPLRFEPSHGKVSRWQSGNRAVLWGSRCSGRSVPDLWGAATGFQRLGCTPSDLPENINWHMWCLRRS